MSRRLMTVLQTAAFLFRHGTRIGSPARYRSEVSAFRERHSSIELRGIIGQRGWI